MNRTSAHNRLAKYKRIQILLARAALAPRSPDLPPVDLCSIDDMDATIIALERQATALDLAASE